MTAYQTASVGHNNGDAMSVYAISRVSLDGDGRIAQVLWGVVDTKSNRWVSAEMRAPLAEVLEAIHNGDPVMALFPSPDGHSPVGHFVAVEHQDGRESIAIAGPALAGRGIADMETLAMP